MKRICKKLIAVVFVTAMFAGCGKERGKLESGDVKMDIEEHADIMEDSKDGYETHTEESTMQEENQEFEISMKQEGFRNTLRKLIEEEGVFQESQRGTKNEWDDVWFDPKGIVSAAILDFDSDGEDEMLVCHTKISSVNAKYYDIVMDMYEFIDGKVVLADSMPFIAYHEGQSFSGVWADWKDDDMLFDLNAVWLKGNCYLMCEMYSLTHAYADGSSREYWAVTYKNNEWQYAGSFSQTDGGSTGFEFTGYEFENGICKNSALYFSDYGNNGETVSLYDSFSDAITAFFEKLGIFLTDDVSMNPDVDSGTILSENNDRTEIFEFTNRLVSASSNFPDRTCEFLAALKRDTLLEEVQKQEE